MKKITILVLLVAALCNFSQPIDQSRADIGGGGGTTLPPKGAGPTITMNSEGVNAHTAVAY